MKETGRLQVHYKHVYMYMDYYVCIQCAQLPTGKKDSDTQVQNFHPYQPKLQGGIVKNVWASLSIGVYIKWNKLFPFKVHTFQNDCSIDSKAKRKSQKGSPTEKRQNMYQVYQFFKFLAL